MRRFSSRLTSGRSSTPRTRVKMAALAPMPSARVNLLPCLGEQRARNLKPSPGNSARGSRRLASGDGPKDHQGLFPGHDGVGQRCVRRFVGQILFASEETQEGPAPLRYVITDGAAQHRILGLKRIDHRALCGLAADFELHLAADARQPAQMWREYDPNHGSVWTSTESTAGRSRTMGAQLSPASAEAYTCPPVVPKYTPHLSRESTAMASRKTLT